MNTLLESVQELVAEYMHEISRSFKPGVKITVLVRIPDHPTRDFMMTDDSCDDLIAMIHRRKEAMK